MLHKTQLVQRNSVFFFSNDMYIIATLNRIESIFPTILHGGSIPLTFRKSFLVTRTRIFSVLDIYIFFGLSSIQSPFRRTMREFIHDLRTLLFTRRDKNYNNSSTRKIFNKIFIPHGKSRNQIAQLEDKNCAVIIYLCEIQRRLVGKNIRRR